MQAPESWLNHNRYAYCLHNPVMYTDPDGESILAAIAIGAFIGGGLNYGIKKYNGQINSVGDAFAAFGWGALGGAAGTNAQKVKNYFNDKDFNVGSPTTEYKLDIMWFNKNPTTKYKLNIMWFNK